MSTWIIFVGLALTFVGVLLTRHTIEVVYPHLSSEPGCTWVGTGEKMDKHWDRLHWNVQYILDDKTLSPHALNEIGLTNNKRTAFQDITHSLLNVPVEFSRACPYIAGHIWFWQNMFTIFGLFGWYLTRLKHSL